MNSKEFFTPIEAASELEASQSSIYDKMNSGEIKFVEKLRGLRKVKLIPASEIEKLKKMQI